MMRRRRKISCPALGAFLLGWIQLHLMLLFCAEATHQTFSGCNVSDYYETLDASQRSAWTKAEVGQWLRQTHRYSLPYTNNAGLEDTWDALIDLDSWNRPLPQTVHLVYSNEDVAATPYGTTDTWNREHMWPKSRGVGEGGDDYTDLHHLRPADWNVNAARNNLLFGECTVSCDTPAHPEAAQDTSKDSTVFLPPRDIRGDVARAMFYMETRYFGMGDDPDLELTDCPDGSDGQLAYLSQLLAWHFEDPVDASERARNDRICESWQGNRNPFVDFDGLVEQFYGLPQSTQPQGQMVQSPNYYNYPLCKPTLSSSPSTSPPPTMRPTSSDPTIDQCALFKAGDILPIALRSDDPDLVAFVALRSVPAGLQLYLTDRAWMGDSFRSTEGTVVLTVPPGGIEKGSIFGFASDASSGISLGTEWTRAAGGQFSLSASGDNIFLYCQVSSSSTTSTSNNSDQSSSLHFLIGLSNAGAFLEPNQDSDVYGTKNSALPLELLGLEIALPHFDNYFYTGTRSGTQAELVTALTNPQNWQGSNEPVEFSMQSFDVLADNGATASPTTSAGRRITYHHNMSVLAGIVMVLTSI